MRKRLNRYELVGDRFENNNAAVGNILADYTNASQVITARLKDTKKRKLNQNQIARLQA